ncbi:alpha/beta hydrolase fold-3 domain protein [Exophiala viscosa]|uniref:Alpha/beta hydrolase fold-3 domain protein n=1 Tax=Exophiala viscosa TaxID=2486360 RepID=A0AAN6E0C8_9EURO|nr:alpha/beta hydrolase fold-3 domain protein [Exophiala viscosa]
MSHKELPDKSKLTSGTARDFGGAPIAMAENSQLSKYSELGKPTEEWEEFYAAHADEVPVLVGSPEHMRKIMVDLKQRAQSQVSPITQGLKVHDVQMPTSDGASISLRIYQPMSEETLRPGLFYVHGGGWTLGDLEGEDLTCRAMCVRAGVVVVSVDYRLAPEHPFPRGTEDSWEALQWTVKNQKDLRIRENSLIIGGSSSGGHTTAVLSHRVKNGSLLIKGSIMRIPSVCHIDRYPAHLGLHSLEELKDAPLLSKRSMELFYGYLNPPDTSDPEASPLLNPSFLGHPPTYLQVAGMDPLRDEGLAYADKLRNAGVPVKVDVYPGLPHAFGYFPKLTAAKKNADDLISGIKWLLAGAR